MSISKKETKCPLISFVVVTHERPLELVKQRIIKSIFNQDYPRKELILIGESCYKLTQLVNDIKNNFQFENFKWLNVPRPVGDDEMCVCALIGKCRNRGISLAQGEFISCQDDDNELESNFISSLFESIIKNNAEAAWCYRKIFFSDGSPYQGDFIPWFQQDYLKHRIIYRIWKNAGIVTPGSNIVRDQICAKYYTQIFSTVDANEWLVKAEIFRQFPFREKYSHEDLCSNVCQDDLWNIDIRKAGVNAVCSEKASLIYYLGGMSNNIFENLKKS